MNKDLPPKTLNIAIQQPALPAYRIPVFAALNACENLEVELFYSVESDLKNAPPEGFKASERKDSSLKIPVVGELYFNKNQFKLAGDTNWDVIIYPWNTRYLSLVPALIRAKINRIPTIIWGHGYSKRPSFLTNLIRNSLTKLSTAALFYDPISMKKCGAPAGRSDFFTAPNAIDQSHITAAKHDWLADEDRLISFKKEQGISDRPVFLFVSRLQKENQIELLLDAVATAKHSQPNILLTIVGGGSEEYEKQLQQKISALNIQDNVRFTGPLYQEEQLAPWFLSSTAFCYPSNIGLSLMHAFGYGLPVIIGDDLSKCNPEIYAFKPEYNGLTFKDGDAGDLASKMDHLVNQSELHQRLGSNAIQTIAEKANIENMVAGFCDAVGYATSSTSGEKR